MTRLEIVRDALGFDRATEARDDDGTLSGEIIVACSQCAAVTINGTPCHETGCTNATKECGGCNARIPARPSHRRFCEDCA